MRAPLVYLFCHSLLRLGAGGNVFTPKEVAAFAASYPKNISRGV